MLSLFSFIYISRYNSRGFGGAEGETKNFLLYLKRINYLDPLSVCSNHKPAAPLSVLPHPWGGASSDELGTLSMGLWGAQSWGRC